jgi:hypothetical protein
MKRFKEAGFAERLDTAAKARRANLKKFEQSPPADDPAQIENRLPERCS